MKIPSTSFDVTAATETNVDTLRTIQPIVSHSAFWRIRRTQASLGFASRSARGPGKLNLASERVVRTRRVHFPESILSKRELELRRVSHRRCESSWVKMPVRLHFRSASNPNKTRR